MPSAVALAFPFDLRRACRTILAGNTHCDRLRPAAMPKADAVLLAGLGLKAGWWRPGDPGSSDTCWGPMPSRAGARSPHLANRHL